MNASAETLYPPHLPNEHDKKRLAHSIKDWSIAHGLVVRPPSTLVSAETDPEGVLAATVPVTLFPSPFPEMCFEQAKAVQKPFNELYARISQDEEFIEGVVKEMAQGDEFIARLWDIHLEVKKEGYAQSLSLGLFRSDYMVHQDESNETVPLQIKQVEFNTIASSFGGLSSQTCELHRFLAKTEYPLLKDFDATQDFSLPPNNSTQDLAAGLRAAWDAYGPSQSNVFPCILFIVQADERNIFDQRHLEYALRAGKEHDARIPVFRLPFSQVHQSTSICSPGRELLYHLAPDQTFEVAVLYFRAGYGPSDYPSPASWSARHRLERSAAIKCPSILTQLAGMKKVQQVLATDSELLPGFLPQAAIPALRATFTTILPMDSLSPAGRQARELATSPVECHRFVLKPQREGGGNNHYRSSIPKHLAALPQEKWASYILMELITPPPLANTILRHGKLEQGGVVCELGRYGACLWNQATKEILLNEDAGYLLRTKGCHSEEGGVAAGFGCMDSCRLV